MRPHFGRNPRRPLRLAVEEHDDRFPVGHDPLLRLAVDGVRQRHAAASQLGDARADAHGIGIRQLAPVMTRDRSDQRRQVLGGHQVSQAVFFQQPNPGGFEPAQRNRVVDVPESVLVAPLDRQCNDRGVAEPIRADSRGEASCGLRQWIAT